jgi:hypothetical protein
MTNHDQRRAWSRFLEAEAAGRFDRAEEELFVLFRALPRPAPSAGFAGRVMAQVVRRRPFARPVVRFGLAAALVGCFLGAALLLPMVPSLAALLSPGTLVAGFADLLASIAGRFAAGAADWQEVGSAARALGRAVAQPPIFALVAAQLLVAALALRALARLAVSQRSPDHAAI